MNRVTLSMTAEQFLEVMVDPVDSVDALRGKLRDLFRNEPDGNTKRLPGRPLQAKHPHLHAVELVRAKDELFGQEQIANNPDWACPTSGKKPSRFAVDQDDMGPDEIRLDNGVVAVMNGGLEDIPPMPRY